MVDSDCHLKVSSFQPCQMLWSKLLLHKSYNLSQSDKQNEKAPDYMRNQLESHNMTQMKHNKSFVYNLQERM